ncbi:MAG: addiction module toxin, HicA family [Bacteroidetes bacterium CG23_combo_of_CG06-09_8_20_14_all_32_9]|nr:MAG: addiction module toxin, HicA family [Bacteroidetes bacterium CG23_combo_of_CG06-09_8_20_14_all_32_9]
MKLINFVRHLRSHKCELLRQGGNHSVYINTENGKISSIPCHKEIKNNLCRKICKDLEISSPFYT